MKSFSKKITILLLILCILFVIVQSVSAATNCKAFQVYRYKNTYLDLHAGLMRYASSSSGNSVVHATSGTTVSSVSWSTFMGLHPQDDFVGVYRPILSMTDAQRDAVVDTALDLDAYNIAYDMGRQIKYNTSNMNGSKVQPNQLTTCRCDGLVEYSYEYNNIRISGTSTAWNISLKYQENYNQGSTISGFLITPAIQATNYMTLVQYSYP